MRRSRAATTLLLAALLWVACSDAADTTTTTVTGTATSVAATVTSSTAVAATTGPATATTVTTATTVATTTTLPTPTTTLAGPPPDLEIVTPAPGNVVAEPIVTISGNASPGATVAAGEVTTESVGPGRWILDVPLTAPGRNEITVVATLDGGSATATREVRYLPDAELLFGYVIGTDATAAAIGVDLAEIFVDEAAAEAALADGEIDRIEDFSGSFYFRNPDGRLTSFPVADGAVAELIGYFSDLQPDVRPIAIPFADFAAIVAGDFEPRDWLGGDPREYGFSLVVVDGVVEHIAQPPVP